MDQGRVIAEVVPQTCRQPTQGQIVAAVDPAVQQGSGGRPSGPRPVDPDDRPRT